MHAVDHYITVNGPIQLASLGRMSILMLRGCEYEPKLGHTEDFSEISYTFSLVLGIKKKC